MRASAKSGTNRTSNRDANYTLFAVNFYDNGLKAVRDEYIKRVKDGLRRSVFILDLDAEIAGVNTHNDENFRGSRKKSESKITDPLEIVQNFIADCCRDYDFITKKIEEELQFNMLTYWSNNMKVDAMKVAKAKDNGKKTTETRRTSKQKTGKKDLTSLNDSIFNILCYNLAPKEHNKVGKGQQLSKRVYIQDQPLSSKIFIVLVGTMSNEFFMELLKNRLPLCAIIHFLPEECNYDLLVPRPRREKYLQDTFESIQKSIHHLRKRIVTKPIGIFQQQLPVMSACLASKYTNDIFDQLSWYLYDRETVREWYNLYYLTPFIEINVKMTAEANLSDAYNMADSLSIQGHYLKTSIPTFATDDASIYMYLESLLSTFGSPRELLNEMEVLLLANPSSAIPTKVLDKIRVYVNAFISVLRMGKSPHLFVEQTNRLLQSMFAYAEPTPLRNLYHCCLEYNLLRKYFETGYLTKSLPFKAYNGEMEPYYLPKFAQLYLSHDCVLQRIVELVDEYDDYSIEETYPNVKLYTFKRSLNEVFEYEKETVIPTRLCFRDFTLYEMNTFLNDLTTPEMNRQSKEERATLNMLRQLSAATIQSGVDNDLFTVHFKDGQELKIDLSIFIRPKSLKARRIVERSSEVDNKRTTAASARSETKRASRQNRGSKRNRNRGSIQDSYISQPSLDNEPGSYIGLRPNHPMLFGYNLDDARQTVKTKISKYHFEEGKIQLYEERWNFAHLNKTLMLDINKLKLYFTSLPKNVKETSRNFRMETKNDVSLRVFTEDSECAKAVINYPTGLSIFCHEKHAEQLWVRQDTINDERRRIYTPYGCVIVFYNSDDMVLVIRYNGEVFYLYNYLDDVEEEEEVISELNTFYSNASSGSAEPVSNKRTSKNRKSKTNGNGGDASQFTDVSTDVKQNKSAKRKTKASRANIKQAILSSVDSEMKYLEFIMILYKLDYLHLKLVTAFGRVVHVLKTGKVYSARALLYSEWRDYFANEEYVMREDGVKLLWTANDMKCYHADGTVIITKMVEGFDAGVLDDELDKLVTQSSSHERINISSAFNSEVLLNDNRRIFINTTDDSGPFDMVSQASEDAKRTVSDIRINQKTNKKQKFISNAEYEEEESLYYDPTFDTYVSSSYFMQHKYYAGILFTFEQVDILDIKINIEVFAADDMHFKIYQDTATDHELCEEFEEEELNLETPEVSTPADSDEWTRTRRSSKKKSSISNKPVNNSSKESTIIEIDCNDVNVIVKDKCIELDLNVRKFGCTENTCVVRDHLYFDLFFTKSLPTQFRDWVQQLAHFINCACPKWKTLYFIEMTLDDCKKKGFELLSVVPPLKQYNFCAGNVIMDIDPLQTIESRMENIFPWYEADMSKFPRFQKPKKRSSTADVPNVLNVNVYVEIPYLLTNTDRIYQFVDPFDKIRFRKLNHRLEEALLFHLHPRLRIMLMKEISNRSWKAHHVTHGRRLFLEQQRLGLYMAMLKHKVYPNYFQFVDKFYSHVRNIDFFNFMTEKCNEKDNPSIYNKNENETGGGGGGGAGGGGDAAGGVAGFDIKDMGKAPKRKKCWCPKYLASMKK